MGRAKCLRGCTCYLHSPERRAALSKHAKAQAVREGTTYRSRRTAEQWAKRSPEQRRAIATKAAESLRGRTQPPEERAARAEAQRTRWKKASTEERRANVAAALAARSGRRVSRAEIDIGIALDFAGLRYEHQAQVCGWLVDYLVEGSFILEVDGAYWHNAERDAARDAVLLEQGGYAVIRVDAKAVARNPVGALINAVIAFGPARGV